MDRYQKSRELLARASQSLTGGVSSPFRAKMTVPLYFKDGDGPRLWDVDGNEYIDYTLAWGPLILGHKHPALVEAMKEAAGKPYTYGAQHELEIEVSEKFQRMVPGAERICFTSSGSEAVQLAWRLARGATGRNLILRFEGHYHGWLDSVLISYRAPLDQMGPIDHPHKVLQSKGQTPNAADNIVVANWNDLEAVERAFAEHPNQIAAVIMEPVLCNSGSVLPSPGYLEGVRRITQQQGALLIFDEVITGFRMSPGGAQGYFDITPDIATFGKAVAGGVTLSAVAGRKDIMELIMQGVAYGGTFNGNPLSLAAANATLDVLAADDGAALKHANQTGLRLMEGIRCAAKDCGLPVQVTGFGGCFHVHFTDLPAVTNYRHTFQDKKDVLERYLQAALDEGLWLLPEGRVYVSAVHGDREVEDTLGAVRRVFGRIA
ncbi:MAG: aspartate aminotransferase family protein [Bryobacteraceae bacterium]